MNPVYASVREISEAIRTGETSPVDLAEVFIGRLRKHGPKLNSVVTIMEDRALKEAKEAQREIREKGQDWGLRS